MTIIAVTGTVTVIHCAMEPRDVHAGDHIAYAGAYARVEATTLVGRGEYAFDLIWGGPNIQGQKRDRRTFAHNKIMHVSRPRSVFAQPFGPGFRREKSGMRSDAPHPLNDPKWMVKTWR